MERSCTASMLTLLQRRISPIDEATQAHLMFTIAAPSGGAVHIPESAREDREYFTTFDSAAKEYLAAEGYVVIRKLIEPALCASIRDAFGLEVKTYGGFL